MSTTIVDQFGRPAVYISPTGQRYKGPEDDRYHLTRPRLDDDIAKLLSREKFKLLLCDARWIHETFPVVNGAVRQKREYVSAAGWLPEFSGQDEKWGEVASEKLHDALNISDVRGMFSWDRLWQTACGLCDIDGGSFEIFTESENGFPQSQFIEAHRVGQRSGTVNTVGLTDAYTVTAEGKKIYGAYAGLRILNGIIYNAAGREVAYRVLGENFTEDRDISARDMQHICEPVWYSEGRPFPTVACAILDWYDSKQSRELQRIKQSVNSALTMTEENATGEAPPDTPGPESTLFPNRAKPTNGAPTYQVMAGGLIRYVKSGSGKINVHTANDPSDGWRNFDKTIVSGAMYGMGWHSGMMDATELSRSATYAVQDWINTTLINRHSQLKRFVLRSARRTLAKLIARGDVPKHSEWYKWDVPQPPEFSVDASRAQQADRDNMRAGIDSERAVIRRTTGRGYKAVLADRAAFLAYRNELAKKFDLDPDQLATLSKPGDSNTIAADLAGNSASDREEEKEAAREDKTAPAE